MNIESILLDLGSLAFLRVSTRHALMLPLVASSLTIPHLGPWFYARAVAQVVILVSNQNNNMSLSSDANEASERTQHQCGSHLRHCDVHDSIQKEAFLFRTRNYDRCTCRRASEKQLQDKRWVVVS